MILDGDLQRDWKPGEKRESRIVFIGRDLKSDELERGFGPARRRERRHPHLSLLPARGTLAPKTLLSHSNLAQRSSSLLPLGGGVRGGGAAMTPIAPFRPPPPCSKFPR